MAIAFGVGCCVSGFVLGVFGCVWANALCALSETGPDIVVIDVLDLWWVAVFCDFASIVWAWFWIFGVGLIVPFKICDLDWCLVGFGSVS